MTGVSEGNGAPTQKDTKYDRQLRLWGARGQKALSEARILLLHAGPTATEIMKNLVLPGVGHFTVVDGRCVRERDLNNNFFVQREKLGQPRAKVTAELLKELNPDVSGDYRVMEPEALIDSDPSFLDSYNLVIATQMEEAPLLQLAAAAWERGTPLLIARSYGLIGYIRLQLKEHCIVDAKVGEDLRGYYNLSLCEPLPGVKAMADSLKVAEMPHGALAKIPYVLLLAKARSLWHERHGPAVPNSMAEKRAFVEMIKGMTADAGEENFVEAIKVAYLAYTPVALPEATEVLLADERARSLKADTPDFWVVVRAIGDFRANEGGGRLPLSGSIPDMASSTDNFTALLRVYKAKGEADRAVVAQRVGDLLESVGRPRQSISIEDVELYAKNAFSLQAMRTRTLAEEHASPDKAAIGDALEEAFDFPTPQMNPVLWYLGLRAVDRFQRRRGRFPGAPGSSLHADEEELWGDLQAVAVDAGVGQGADDEAAMEVEPALRRDHAVEMARYGAAELHNIAAILGGVGSQEAVKVLTQQYVPVDHTFVYNGIASVGARYAL